MSDNLHHFKQYLRLLRIFHLDWRISCGYRADIMKRQYKPNFKSIRDYLQRTGKTESELAQLACISQAHVNMLKNGYRRPTPELAARLEAITGIPLRTLLLKSGKRSARGSRSRSANSPSSRAG